MSLPENDFSLTRKVVAPEQAPRGNYRLLRAVILLTSLILILQLAQLQLVEGARYRRAADQNRFRLIHTDALRGIIYDRTGRIVVRNIPSFNVSIVPGDLDRKVSERVLKDLSALLGVPIETTIGNSGDDALSRLPSDVDRRVPPPRRKPGLRELVEKGRRDPYTPVLIKSNVSREIAFYLEERSLDFPGVRVGLAPVREYPEGMLLSHLLGYAGPIPSESYAHYRSQGYVGTDSVGLAGIEYAFEKELRGVKGRRYIQVDVGGREVARLGEEVSTPGKNLVLTIDTEFQKTVQTILQKGMRSVRSKQGVAIVMDPRNGEILAMVALPSYDNNLFATGITQEDFDNLQQDPLHPLVNIAITGQYPPGSTFKMIPASAALQERVIDANTRFTTPGIIWVPHKYFPDDVTLAQPFYDWYKPGFGALAVREGLMLSSDVFFYKVSGGEAPNFEGGLGIDRLAGYTRMFGIGELSGIDLTGEARGLVPDNAWKRKQIGDVWTIGDTYNMGIGQGYLLATPLQVANYTAIVANGGTFFKPQLVHAVMDAKGAIERLVKPEVFRRLPISAANHALVREGMREAVTRGTAVRANLQDIAVAGKTGTAEFFGPKVNGHLPTHAWFVAFAPYENPQVVVTVFVYGGGEGSEVAAPLAADILRAYFRLPTDAPLASPPAPAAPRVVARPPSSAGAAAPSRKYLGQVSSTEAWGREPPNIFGTVIDTSGRGVTGIRVGADKCDGQIVHSTTTNADGAFALEILYYKDAARWCIRTLAPDSDAVQVDVAPYKRFMMQFVPTY